MSEGKISETSQNEDDKKDYEAIEMLKTENKDDSDNENDPVVNNDTEKQVTLRRVFDIESNYRSRC